MRKTRKTLAALTAALLTLPALAAAQVTIPGTDGGVDPNLPKGSVVGIINNVMLWLLYLVGALAVIAFVIAGFMYLTSAGDEDQASRAKRTMVYAIIGVIVALLGLIVLNAVMTMLGGETAQF